MKFAGILSYPCRNYPKHTATVEKRLCKQSYNSIWTKLDNVAVSDMHYTKVQGCISNLKHVFSIVAAL